MAKDKKGKGSGTKDACYHKVKSRYSVWPSAYASGALVKCRKVGAANWGNKSESFEINPEKHKEAQRTAEREDKLRKRAKSGDQGSEIAAKKTKGPKMMGEGKYSKSETYVKGTAPVRATYGGKTESFPKETYKKKTTKTEELNIDLAVDYFFTEGINEDGLEMIIEETGLEKFVEFVEYLTDIEVLTEARAARKARKGAKSYEQVKAEIDAKEKAKSAKREISVDKTKKATATAKAKQPEKKPVRDAIARGVFRAVDAYKKGMERHNAAMATAKKAGKVAGKAAGEFAKGAGEGVKTAGKAVKMAHAVATKEEVDFQEGNLQDLKIKGAKGPKSMKDVKLPKFKDTDNPKFKKEEVEIEEGKSDRPLGVMHQFARGVKQKKGEKREKKYGMDSEGNRVGKYVKGGSRALYPEETEVEEGYKEIDKAKENRMYRRAGNLARKSLSSTGAKKKEAASKSAKIVSAISRQKENERFAKMGDEKARDNYEEVSASVQRMLDEAGKKCWKGYKKAGTQKLFGKTYNRCVKANEELSIDQQMKISRDYNRMSPEEKKAANKKAMGDVKKVAPKKDTRTDAEKMADAYASPRKGPGGATRAD